MIPGGKGGTYYVREKRAESGKKPKPLSFLLKRETSLLLGFLRMVAFAYVSPSTGNRNSRQAGTLPQSGIPSPNMS